MSDQIEQHLTLHLNGGEEFSEMHYVLWVGGKVTKITKHVQTNGSPEYKIMISELHFGDDTLDLLISSQNQLTKWIEERAIKDPLA